MKNKTLIYLSSCIIIPFSFACSPKYSNENNKNLSDGSQDTTTIYVISTNELKSKLIPNKVFQMKNLKRLSIQGMDCDRRHIDKDGNEIVDCWTITEIPSEIKNLTKLEMLQLNVNSIQKVPREISDLHNLKTLELSDNPTLSNIDAITTLTNLEMLTLFGCGLTKLPTDIGQLKKLKYLGLTGNNIDSIELDRIKKALPTCEISYEK